MAAIRPLRLKSQVGRSPDGPVALELPIAHLWVDNGVPHLDGRFDYLIPEKLSEFVRVGVMVSVPFAGKEIEGLVLGRSASSTISGLKTISSLLSAHPVATEESISLIAKVAARWAAHPFDIIRSAIPPRIASVEKSFSQADSSHIVDSALSPSPSRQYLLFSPGEDPMASLAKIALEKVSLGGVLLIVPEERELDALEIHLKDRIDPSVIARLDGSISRAQRYLNHLRVSSGSASLVIGNRSAIFAPVANLTTVIIYREGAQSHYEVRTPGWNVRDIAILRSIEERASLLFAGYSPSSESARLIESGWLTFVSQEVRLKVSSYSQESGELLPPRIFAPIRSALKVGPVLFLAPRKGYASALMCRKCRNIAKCECGGKLLKTGKSTKPQCSHCSKIYEQWKCQWCQGETPFLLGRGSDRFGEEIGRAFPGYLVLSSTAEGALETIASTPSLVIATAGMQPRVEGGYSAVVLLEGASFFGEVDMRAQERSRESFFQSASLVRKDGVVLVVIDGSHPITASLTRWNPSIMATRELQERLDVALPPFYRSATIELAEGEAITVVKALQRALLEGRLPPSTKILGPSLREKGMARILMTSSLEEGGALVDLLHEFSRKRAVAKKPSISLRIDPYSLS